MSVREARKALGVGAQATPGELRRAFRQAAKSVHPDRPGGDAEAFRRLVAAYDLLRTAAEAPRKFIQPPAPRPPARAAQGSVGDPHTLSVPPLVAFAGGAVEHRLADGRKLRISCPPGLRAGDRLRAGGEVLIVAVRGDGALIVRGCLADGPPGPRPVEPGRALPGGDPSGTPRHLDHPQGSGTGARPPGRRRPASQGPAAGGRPLHPARAGGRGRLQRRAHPAAPLCSGLGGLRTISRRDHDQ